MVLGQDRPVELAGDDLLDRAGFVSSLARALVVEEHDLSGRVVARHATGVVVGLTGKWGAGKSTILNLLAEQLKGTDHVVVATFNPWLFKGRDELVSAFFNELRAALGRSATETVREAVTALDRYRAAITAGGELVALGADSISPAWVGKGVRATLGLLKIVTRPKGLSPQQEREALEKKLGAAKVAVVVLVDELDRVEDDEVRAVAQLVKAVGDIKGVSYLVAYDPKRVAEALGRGDVRAGEAYLEKIVQHPIPVRPLFAGDVTQLFARLLEHHALQLPADLTEDERAVVACVQSAVQTPRDLKRLVGAYAVLERMLRQEVSAADLLGYSWLAIKAPSLRDAIASNHNLFVDDPTAEELGRRISDRIDKRDPDLDHALGGPAGVHAALLKLLFPRFGGGEREHSGYRLSLRRNLVRAIYLGDAPDSVRRERLEEMWGAPDVGSLTVDLGRALTSGELGRIFDRLDDLFPKLPESGDAAFWRALAHALLREDDWYLNDEPHRAYANDAAAVLMQLGRRDVKDVRRAKSIVASLLSAEDTVLLPIIVRKHLFRWGLTRYDSFEGRGPSIFDRAETEELLSRSVPIFRASILDGSLLRRVPNSEAMWVLSNVDRWDEQLRKSLTSQLASYEGRASFASLTVPPGYGVGRSSLEELFDVDIVLARMKEAGEGATFEDKSWTNLCLRRLRRTLEGRDTMFDDGTDDASP
ncbi:MAG: NTPase [Phenylobacterium sp.]|uniref:P-loop NTPase fold protein n=1 Tax=Phenylobacterium sp. TaxID=1871053 RepID=UPI0025DF8B0B|nr:P-loop NTPase fold protein [Phenylobacterium sp.]MBA4010782.1 NTPase [Phenylobacterium sp.]